MSYTPLRAQFFCAHLLLRLEILRHFIELLQLLLALLHLKL
jgi:hypothetical protein